MSLRTTINFKLLTINYQLFLLAQHLVDDGIDVGDVDLAVAGDVGRGGALAQHHINGRIDI